MSGKKSFWTTIPGILTGLAAVITAATGLYIATNRDDIGNQPEKLTSTPSLTEVQSIKPSTLQSIDKVKSITSESQSKVDTLTKTDKAETSESGNLESMESESNDDLSQSTSIPLGKWIDASIGSESDVDYYRIKTPETYADLVKIELENQSTTLKPYIGVYLENKQLLGGTSGYQSTVTAGQDVEYTFNGDPDTNYYIQVTSLDKKPSNYKLKVFTLNAYDQHEPNDEILKSKPIKLNSTVEANFTDKRDVDFYKIDTPGLEKNIKVMFEYLSTKIKPYIGVYLENKQLLGGTSGYQSTVTAGQDTEFVFKADPNSVYYIHIVNLAGTEGEYKIKVIEQDVPEP